MAALIEPSRKTHYDRSHADEATAELEQRTPPSEPPEEVVALVVDDDERGKVLDLDLPDGFHAELGVTAVPAGSVFVVPRGRWHRQHAREHAGVLFATGATDISWADDPRASADEPRGR